MIIFSAAQLVAHLLGDYVLQSAWMAENKTKRSWPALVHALVYSLPFSLLVSHSGPTLLVIIGTHFVIDRWRLARYVCWLKNYLGPGPFAPWSNCRKTGFSSDVPAWLAVWLMIIIDNTIHIVINGLAVVWLG